MFHFGEISKSNFVKYKDSKIGAAWKSQKNNKDIFTLNCEQKKGAEPPLSIQNINRFKSVLYKSLGEIIVLGLTSQKVHAIGPFRGIQVPRSLSSIDVKVLHDATCRICDHELSIRRIGWKGQNQLLTEWIGVRFEERHVQLIYIDNASVALVKAYCLQNFACGRDRHLRS